MEVEKSGDRFYLYDVTEHPEGGDRGGWCCERHDFVLEAGLVRHVKSFDVDEPEAFDVSDDDLKTKEEALKYVDSCLRLLLQKVETLKSLKSSLESSEYVDDTEDCDYDEEDDEEDDES